MGKIYISRRLQLIKPRVTATAIHLFCDSGGNLISMDNSCSTNTTPGQQPTADYSDNDHHSCRHSVNSTLTLSISLLLHFYAINRLVVFVVTEESIWWTFLSRLLLQINQLEVCWRRIPPFVDLFLLIPSLCILTPVCCPWYLLRISALPFYTEYLYPPIYSEHLSRCKTQLRVGHVFLLPSLPPCRRNRVVWNNKFWTINRR